MEEWLAPEAEKLGKERWPWEFDGSGGATFKEYVAECKAAASTKLHALADADMEGTAITTSNKGSKAGATLAGVVDQEKWLLLQQDNWYKQPVRKRLAGAPRLLPPARVSRLWRELELRNGEQLEALARQGQTQAEQGNAPVEGRLKQKRELLKQRKAEEAEAARVEAAVGRSQVVSSYLSLHLPPHASLPDLLALLEREARLPLAALQAGLQRLGEQGALVEGEVQDLHDQLLYLAEESCKSGGAAPLLAFRLPPHYAQQYSGAGWRDAEEYRMVLEATVMDVGRQELAELRKAQGGLLGKVLDVVAALAGDSNDAARRLCRHVTLDPGSLPGTGAQHVRAITLPTTPWAAPGQQLSLGKLPFLVQAALPNPDYVQAAVLQPFPAVALEDLAEVFPRVALPALAPPAGQQRQRGQWQQASTSGASSWPRAGTPDIGDTSGEASTESWAGLGDQHSGSEADSAAGDIALGPLPSPGTAGYASAGEPQESLADDSDLEGLEHPFVGRGSSASEVPETPSPATRSRSEYESGQSEGEGTHAARQLEVADRLAELLRRQLECRQEMLRMSAAANFLPAERRGEPPERYSKAPLVQAAYLLADACLRPALLGHQLIACLAAGEQQAQQLSMEPQAEPQHLAHLAATWESREPLHVLLAQLEGVSEADAEDAVRPLVNSLMRSEARVLAEAAPPGRLEGPALLRLLQNHQLDACADLSRRLNCNVQLSDLEEAAHELQQYKRVMVHETLHGLHLLHKNMRLTQQQFEAIKEYIWDLTPTPGVWYAQAQRHLDRVAKLKQDEREAWAEAQGKLPKHVIEEAEGSANKQARDTLLCKALEEHGEQLFLQLKAEAEENLPMWQQQAVYDRATADLGRAALLPIRALERLHAFVCLLVFDAFGAPEEAGLELVGAVTHQQCVGQLVETEPEGQRPGSSCSQDDTTALLEGLSLAVRGSGLEVALGLQQGMPLQQALHRVACFAAGVAVGDPCSLTPSSAAGGHQQLPQQHEQPGGPGGKPGGQAAKRRGAAGGGAAAGPEGSSAASAAPPCSGPCQLAAQPWQLGPVGDVVLCIAGRYLALATCLEALVHLLRGLEAQLQDCDQVLAPLRGTLDNKCNLEGCAAALLSETLLQVRDAQMQLMWQAQRAQDACDALVGVMRSHLHASEAQLLEEAHGARADGGRPPALWGLHRPLPSLQELKERHSREEARAQDCLEGAKVALQKTGMGWKNWAAVWATQPGDCSSRHRRLLNHLDRLRSLLDRALARGEGGEGGASSHLRLTLSDSDEDSSPSDDEWRLLSAGSLGGLGGSRRRGPADLDEKLERGMFECLGALQELWHSDQFLELRRGLRSRREELAAAQGEAYRAARLRLGLLLRKLGCALCPADSLARCMLAHLLPEQWRPAVEQAEAKRRECAWLDLVASEGEVAAGTKKKKKKGKKGAGQAAAQAAQSAAHSTEADEEEQGGQGAGEEDDVALLGLLQLQRGQQAPGQKGAAAQHQQQAATAKAAAPAGPAERQEGYQRMLREYEEAQHAQHAQQAGSRGSSRASRASLAAPSLAAAATADTASSAGADSSTLAAGQETQAVAPGALERDGDGEQQHSLAALQAASQAFDWSGIEGADADDSWRQDGAPPAAADWQEAPSQRPAADKACSGAAAVTGSAGSKPGKAAAADEEGEQQAEQQRAEQQQRRQQQPQRPAIDPSKPRVVGWDGSWVCKCGRRHRVSEACKACSTAEPCRDYLKSGCPYGRRCRFSHPPFALEPPHPPPPGRRPTLVTNPKALPAGVGKQATDDWRVRVVSWIGEWVCPCEEAHLVQHSCTTCGYPS